MSENPKDPTFLQECLSLLLDFVPFVGTGKSGLELINGKDVITGQHINRWLAAGGIILGVVPFGKLLTKGKKSKEMIELIANNIVYGASNKAELIKKMEKVIPTTTRELEEGFILQEIKKIESAEFLKYRFGMKINPSEKRSDMNLVHQLLVQMNYGGHALQKHWFSGEKHVLLKQLTAKQKKRIQSKPTDAEEVVEYLKLILNDPKTVKLNLPNRGRVGFANAEKKVVIIHNPDPKHQGNFRFEHDPIDYLTKQFETEIKGK